MTARFVPGLRLAEGFYADVVRPLVASGYPGLRYSAALIGWGSEVLGFDSERSTDHNWGPRLQLFVTDDAVALADEITDMLSHRLPETYRGYPVVFRNTEHPDVAAGHWVHVEGLGAWLENRLGISQSQELSVLDWLAMPTQRLAEVTAGAVFDDGLQELNELRARLAWYPHEVWLYVLACQWQRVAQEEAFPGRCSEAGDELGSAIVAGRLGRDLMRLWLLMHRRYPPYSKWLGTAFASIPQSAELGSSLAGTLAATTYPDREKHLCEAYRTVAALHNQLGLTEPLQTSTRGFFERPYQVLDAGRFSTALVSRITDAGIRRLPLLGAVDQYIDSTDALGDRAVLRVTAAAAAGRRQADD